MLASAFVDKPLCVARQLAELLQLSLEEVCADFDTMLCHDWRSLGVSAEEVRQFCVWRERLLAAVSAADALPRGTTFEKVKGARDRLRGELSSVQRMDGDELVKSATARAHRLNQRLSRMRKLGMDATTAPADAPEPACRGAHQK